jgi:hypothetical protein
LWQAIVCCGCCNIHNDFASLMRLLRSIQSQCCGKVTDLLGITDTEIPRSIQ